MSTEPAKRFAVLGNPIAHSKSPMMHAAAYRALGMPHAYEAIRAEPGDLATLVQQLRDGVFAGFNVTVPHKTAILAYVDEQAPSARLAGAANTLVRTSEGERGGGGTGRIVAHNTDVAALAGELEALARARPDWPGFAGRKVQVIGSGGAARSAVLAAASLLGVAEIEVRARNPEPFARSMSPLLAASGARARLSVEPLAPGAPRDTPDASVVAVVQATSAGMSGADPGDAVADAVAWSGLPPYAVALDVVYAPPVTPFLRCAEARGLHAANGLGMLARQGALAFQHWLAVPPPYEPMLAALTAATAARA